VVITGGEPLIAPELPALVERLSGRAGGGARRHITIETAGTVHVPLRADLWSISPKLSNSTPLARSGAPADAGDWAARHEERRRRPDVVRRLMEAGDYQLKFVVGAPADVDEVLQLLEELEPVERGRVLLMPQARSVAELDAAAAWLPALCRQHALRFGDRLHIRLFGNTRGT
jgi:7-carboxy-7-deazaguanine synthase